MSLDGGSLQSSFKENPNVTGHKSVSTQLLVLLVLVAWGDRGDVKSPHLHLLLPCRPVVLPLCFILFTHALREQAPFNHGAFFTGPLLYCNACPCTMYLG